MTRANRLGAAMPFVLAMATLALAQAEREAKTDLRSGLAIAPGWELVNLECTGCHSTALILQTREDREGWLGLIRWMQETQELGTFEKEVEERIVAYLSHSYGLAPGRHRRPPLPPHLMPPTRAGSENEVR